MTRRLAPKIETLTAKQERLADSAARNTTWTPEQCAKELGAPLGPIRTLFAAVRGVA